MDCSLPCSSVHGIFQARVLEWDCHFLLQGIFPTEGLNLGLLHCRQTLDCLSHQGVQIVLHSGYTDLHSNQQCRSDQISHSVVSNSLRPIKSQHTKPPCPSPTPGVHSDSRPSSQRCHPAISSSVIPFSSCPQSHPASESFPMSQLFP